MKHILIRLMVCTLCILISVPLGADCSSCNVTSGTTNCCSKNDCRKFKRKTAAFCSLFAQEFNSTTSYINNATIRNLRVLGDETIDGTLIVNDLATINGDLIIEGDLNGGGTIVPPLVLSQYAYFVRTLDQVVTNDNTLASIIQFDQNGITPTAGITNAPGVGIITFAEAGTYLITFTLAGGISDESFCLTNIPVGGASNIANTAFAQGQDSNQLVGYVILPITAGQQIGVRNVGFGPTTITTNAAPGADTNLAAAITIIKLN